MDLLHIIYEMIELRSFSNLWYWIALAVLWSTASHWVLGVPYDMVHRAQRKGGQAERDLEDITRVNVNRMLFIAEVSGPWLVALSCFVLTGLAMLGFGYFLEIAQAVFLLLFPMALVSLISFATARRIAREASTGRELRRRLAFCRLYIQMIGVVAIIITAFWGMYQNLTIGPF